MKFSFDWIRDFVDLPVGQASSARAWLDQAGLPVESIEEYAGDCLLEVEITPNRPDAMSHRGLARELSAISGKLLRPLPDLYAPPPGEGAPAIAQTTVSIQVPRLCRRFGALLVRGISAASAPERVRSRLAAIGGKSIDAAVDATNYALWDLGQPLHAFDFDRLSGGVLVVRKARKGERLVTLDGIDRPLAPEDVVVADAERAVSLAGIMGGLETAVTPATRNILLEAAWWDPVAIRRTSRRLGMHTDASHRFERGADPESIPDALSLAARLILEAAGGAVAPGMLDVRGQPWKPRRVPLRLSRLRQIAGDERLTLAFAWEALERLGFAVESRGARLRVGIPPRRQDVTREEDLVEEVLRVYGYDRLPSKLPPAIRPGGYLEPRREIEDRLADAAVSAGLYEVINYPFVDHASEEGAFTTWLSESGIEQTLSVSNPLDEARRDLRGTLLPGLLDAVSRNVRFGQRDTALFEIGRVFGRSGGNADDPASLESRRFAFAIAGQARSHWSLSPGARRADFSDARGLVELLVEPWVPAGILRLHPVRLDGFTQGAVARIEGPGGELLGIVGRICDGEREKRSLSEEVFAAEILVDSIPVRPKEASYLPFSLYPPIRADLSFSHRRETTWAEIERFVRGRPNLEAIEVLDRYEGSQAGEGRVKTTIRISFRSAERTLAQEEVNREVETIRGELEAGIGATFG